MTLKEALIWRLTQANNGSLYMQNVTTRKQCLLYVSYLFIWAFIPIMFLHSLFDVALAGHYQVQLSDKAWQASALEQENLSICKTKRR